MMDRIFQIPEYDSIKEKAMQIKFNKIVKPAAAKPEESREVKQETVVKQAAVVPAQNTEQAVQMESFVAEVTKPADAPQTAEAPKTEAVKPAEAANPVSYIVPTVIPPVVPAAGYANIEETLKKFIGQSIRVYTADHENVSGRLESVKDGWIKICNVRSAGGGYYCDEDIINIRNIVRLRFIRNITKSDYVEFTNANN